jgi:amino acid adenylation domain-containing protein
MDPAYPAERLLHMLEDAGCRVLLADEDTPGVLVRHAAEVVWIGSGLEAAAPGETPSGFPDRALGGSPPPSLRHSPADLAYVLYTSGSTGKPKGVEVSHGALLNFLRSMARRPGLGPEDVLLAVTSLSFDIAALELYLPLLVGARLELVERDVAADGMRLLGSLTSSGATVLQATPSTWRLLVEAGWQASPGLKALCGGEALPERLAAELVARAGEVWNLYGPTETTVWSAADRVEAGAPVRIGPPIANTSLVLMSRELEPVPLGVAGELWIGGAGVARGYRGRPDLTAERFVPDPWAGRSSPPGARLYRTGDLARHDGRGRLEFLGRIDHQVKVRGFRIELGEVESALESHPAVERAVAVADGVGGGRLVAYVVPRQPLTTLVPALRAHLAATLPDYMIPTAWVELASVPLTPNGKVDRRALPAVEEQARPYVAPRTPVEELLAALFSEVLERAQVGVHDNFFDLGGHSLIGTRLMARVREAFGVELPLRRLFEGPTVAALAQAIEPELEERALGQAQAEQETAAALAPVPRGQDLPLSFAQQRLWVLDQLEVAGTTYNIAVSLRLRGALSAAALSAALAELSARHESLRTSFPKAAGQPVQRIAPPRAAALPLVDLRRLTAASRQPETARVSATLTRQPFDLATGPLLRTALVALAEDEHLFALTVHHIVADGWSLGVLVRDLAALYQAAVSGEPAGLAPLPVQYPDFAVWQRRWFTGDRLEAQLSYWRRQLAGLPPALPLATDGPRRVGRGPLGTRHLRWTPARTADLRELARREGATPFMVRLAAFAALLWRHTGQEDIPIGTPIANRERVELEPMIGFFVNTLVMRVDLAGDPDFHTLLGRVRERALDAYAHQDLPFERLVEELAPERDLRLNPLFQVMLQVGNLPLAPISLTGLQLVPVPAARGQAMFDLLLSVAEQGEELLGTLDYDAELFAGATAERLARHYSALLVAAAAEPGRRLAELPLLDDAERHQLLDEWNDTAAAYREELCLHELIAAQAARRPEAVAVVYEDGSLTYGELARAAAALAARLVALGVGAESRVGLAVERSLEMMVGVLAILQAGGAYVPLDPDYPRDRLAYMVADAMGSHRGGGASGQAPVVLSLKRLADRLPGDSARVIFLDEAVDAAGHGRPASDRDLAGARRALPDNLAYVIYTSGSTGRPKGAMNSHRAVVNRLLWMQQAYGLTAADRVLQKTPISFDVSVWELFWPLLAGATLVVARPGGHQDPAYLVQLIREQRITTLHFVPSMLQVFLEAPGVTGLGSLRRVFASGEALPAELERRCHERLGSAALYNLYGPTEAAVDVTAWPCERGSRRPTVPIGRPVANTRIHLLDAACAPVPIGVAGELYIGGVQPARGYLDRPELTAERFVPDPFGGRWGEPGGRLYRTGDLARHDGQGWIEFLGRIDHQVKVRGFRIELGEVESTLEAHPAVARAVALADAAGGGRLVAYVLPRATAAAADASVPVPALDAELVARLREHLAQTLPDHMVPTTWVELASVPLTPSGKVDRRALPRPDAVPPLSRAEYVPPRGDLEQLLAGIWAEVLRAERIGAHDSFFELGGHSLLATLAVSRIGEALAIEVPLRRMFEAPTIALLAARLRQDTGPANDLDAAARLVMELLALSDAEVEALTVGQAATAAGPPAGGAA